MKRNIQVHFENGGQLTWNEEIAEDHLQDWLYGKLDRHIEHILQPQDAEMVFARDEENQRNFFFNLAKVTAIIINKQETDLFERTYAAEKGNIQENDRLQYQRDGGQRP